MSDIVIGGGPQLPKGTSPFDVIRRMDAWGEYWSARELSVALGYSKWERFEDAIERAKISCEVAGKMVADHFPGAGKMVSLGSSSQRTIQDYRLSRTGAAM